MGLCGPAYRLIALGFDLPGFESCEVFSFSFLLKLQLLTKITVLIDCIQILFMNISMINLYNN